ncbi:MAG: zf-HC2 domain-containing protein [Elusimicrobia bacterium]|nr:zf-HC2 domain-containing protein [Elusimicrobiota bacterium]
MKCREMLRHLSDYLDRDLDPAICRHIDSHMKGCKPCVAFINTLRKTVGVLKRQPRAALSAGLRGRLRRRLARVG